MQETDMQETDMQETLQHYTDQVIKDYNLPAASLAVWKGGKLYTAASGILNIDTGVEATTDSIFQIGSIAKLFTASLIIKLVEEGRIDLDKPVKHYLRHFHIADPQASETITIKQLLNHTNGIAGDYILDDEKEDGPHIARHVDRCSQLPLVHPVGDGYSYSNAAYVIAGRVVEVVTGMSWYDAMEEMIFEPLNMKHAICRPAEVIRFRAALGHLPDANADNNLRTSSGKYLSLAHSPAGSTTTMTAADLISFGRAHLEKGINNAGERWLTEASIRLMHTPTVEIPSYSDASNAVGLGWVLTHHKASGLHFASHSGGTNGQCAHLSLFPEQGACVAILLNGSRPDALGAINNHLLAMATGIKLETDTAKPDITLDADTLQSYVGQYQSYSGVYNVRLENNSLVATFSESVGEEAQFKVDLVPLEKDCFDQKINGENSIGLAHFSKNAEDIGYRLFTSGRIFQRANAATGPA